MKTVLFLPGFQEGKNSRDYHSVISKIKKAGYRVEFIPIDWKRTTIENWVQQLDRVYSKHNPRDTILAGFSYGAMTALVSSTTRNPYELWLFSLSPYFAEHIKSKNMIKTWLRYIGSRRVRSFSRFQLSQLAPDIKCKTLLFFGELEIVKWPVFGELLDQSRKLFPNNRLTVITGVGHDVTHELYIEAITNSVS